MKKIIPWLILANLAAIPLWVILIVTAPNCDETKRPICKDQPATTSKVSSAEIILPPTSNEIEAALNKFRTSKELPKFNTKVPALDKAAQARADMLCRTDTWSHDGDWDVLSKYYSFSYAGENLYYGSLRKDQVSDAIKTWADSPTHLENMVASYSQVGVGVKSCPAYQGDNSAVIITNYFGVPR